LNVRLVGLDDELRTIVREEIAAVNGHSCFLDVKGAADYLSSTPSAVRSLVKRCAIPVHRDPRGRLLFDRDELREWVLSGDA